jgi:hypothetical protein
MNALATWALGLTMFAAPANPIEWTNDYGAALKAARAERKPLLVVIENPAESAVRFDEISLVDQQPSRQLLAKYKLCRVDASTPYGQAVAKAFRAASVPTTSIIDRTGSVQIFVKAGRLTAAEWQATLARHQSGARPEPVICST